MALIVETNTPKQLIHNIKALIEVGKIRTWEIDSEGDLTHTRTLWNLKAWMRPYVQADIVIFGIVVPEDRNLSKREYAIYHGRLAEMLLAHFDDSIDAIHISSMFTDFDIVS